MAWCGSVLRGLGATRCGPERSGFSWCVRGVVWRGVDFSWRVRGVVWRGLDFRGVGEVWPGEEWVFRGVGVDFSWCE